jgi:hypothetical protein
MMMNNLSLGQGSSQKANNEIWVKTDSAVGRSCGYANKCFKEGATKVKLSGLGNAIETTVLIAEEIKR